MSLELTPQGAQAYEILAWAQQDPAARAAQAEERIGDIARGCPDGSQELREVQDAGLIAHRLADTQPRTISSQLAG